MAGAKQGDDWCMTDPEPISVYIKNIRMNKVPFHRCPKCKRRLQLKIIKGDDGESTIMFPAHKIRKTKRK